MIRELTRASSWQFNIKGFIKKLFVKLNDGNNMICVSKLIDKKDYKYQSSNLYVKSNYRLYNLSTILKVKLLKIMQWRIFFSQILWHCIKSEIYKKIFLKIFFSNMHFSITSGNIVSIKNLIFKRDAFLFRCI